MRLTAITKYCTKIVLFLQHKDKEYPSPILCSSTRTMLIQQTKTKTNKTKDNSTNLKIVKY